VCWDTTGAPTNLARASAGLLAASDEDPLVYSVCRNPDRELVRTLAPNERAQNVLVQNARVQTVPVQSAIAQNEVIPNATRIVIPTYSAQIVGTLIETDAHRCLVVKVWRVVRCVVHYAELRFVVEELRFVVEELRFVVEEPHFVVEELRFVVVLRFVVAVLQRGMAGHCAGVVRS